MDRPVSAACDPVEVAEDAGLRYVSDEQPGIRRRKAGKGWTYVRPDGSTVNGQQRARITALVIPPAWTDVWICPTANGHIQATGRDDRGRKQYRYHDRWREVRDADKFDQLGSFGAALPELRARLDADLGRRGLGREKVLALVVRLLDETLIRVGNDQYAADNESFGLTTMRPEHVDVGKEKVLFDFTGKSGQEHLVRLHDPELAPIIRRCEELGGQDLFSYVSDGEVVDVTSTDVNDYLREQMGDGITAKHFRTWGGTVVATASLALGDPPEGRKSGERAVLAAYDVAAEVLGNTRAVCRSCYVHPAIPDAYLSGELHGVWKRSRKTAGLSRSERTTLKLLER